MNDHGPRIRETHQMGGAAVVNICMTTGLVGALRLAGVDVSGIVAAFGSGDLGMFLDFAWGTALVLSAALALAAWRLPDQDWSAVTEIGALILHVAAVLVWILAVLVETTNPVGSTFVVVYLGTSCVNCLGRAWLLTQRIWWASKGPA